MKYNLLSVSKFAESTKKISVNIGDYIQAVAASQFYPWIDGFLDRDEDLKIYHDEECKVIMNGWYMHKPDNWPPSKKITPLFVAFHLNTIAREKLLSSESVEYLRLHEPIGCRDIKTMELLKEKGIDAYFSGCMTLTLGYKYHSLEKDDCTYIVDPICNFPMTIKNIATAFLTLFLHPSKIFRLLQISQLKVYTGRNYLFKLIKTALYYSEYSKVFGDDFIMNSKYISQDDNSYRDYLTTEECRFKEAERLIKLYSKAKLVVTSRIHCALPCLGLETPVLFLKPQHDSDISTCRFGGLSELFNTIIVDNGRLYPEFKHVIPITKENVPINSDNWKEYATSLIERCSNFFKQ